MRKLVSILVLVALLVSVCAVGSADAAQPFEVIDSLGRLVTIEAMPETIVSLSPSNTEILFALGVGDKVVGVDVMSDYPPEAAAIETKVGDFNGPNVELILSLEPDIVFADDALQQDVINQLTGLGVTVVAVTGRSYADIYNAIDLVAQCVGADSAPVREQMTLTAQAALELVVEGEPADVYYVLSFGDWGDWTGGKGTFVDEMITMLGANNIGAELGEGWLSISVEKLLAADPDVVLIPGDAAMRDAFMTGGAYADLSAVKCGRVYAVDTNMSQRPGPRIADALMEFANAIYPAPEDAAE